MDPVEKKKQLHNPKYNKLNSTSHYAAEVKIINKLGCPNASKWDADVEELTSKCLVKIQIPSLNKKVLKINRKKKYYNFQNHQQPSDKFFKRSNITKNYL